MMPSEERQISASPLTKIALRITSVRARGHSGGAIFSGKSDLGEAFVVVASFRLLPDSKIVDKGQVWTVEGTLEQRSVVVNGYKLLEKQIQAIELHLDRPSGHNIIHWIAECPQCVGIGQVKARRLYERFGLDLVDLIEDERVASLTEVIDEAAADALCAAFKVHGIAQTLLWLDRLGIPRKIGSAVSSFYKDAAREKIEANPYALISFETKWQTVDDIATRLLKIAPDDVRRLDGAVEEVLYRGMKSGHTYLPSGLVRSGLRTLLTEPSLVDKALDTRRPRPSFRQTRDGLQTTGAFLVEEYVAQRLTAMVQGRDTEGQGELYRAPEINSLAAERSLDRYQAAHGIDLSKEQKDAVRVSTSSHVSLIIGGAGTGKTTVLKALFQAVEDAAPGTVIYQLALAGRAAQRMTEATGRESKTIAAFLHDKHVSAGCLIVIDEMSMVDVILMYRLLRHIPQGVRLVLVGDPAQLPPIGPGLVLHCLTEGAIPMTELKVVQRQTSASGIPQVAAAIREHREPSWATYDGIGSGVSFLPCALNKLDAAVERIYKELGGNGCDYDVQILSPTKGREGGVKGINEAIHHRFHGNDEPIRSHDPEFGLLNEATADGIRLTTGDLVMYTENDYQLGLRNGSLGRVIRSVAPVDDESVCCLVEFDGMEHELTIKHLRAVTHAYAITIHKSQGSQFRRVLIPIRASKMLDQALIYTAVTRGVDQVVLIGDRDAVMSAISASASASLRHTMLGALLSQRRVMQS